MEQSQINIDLRKQEFPQPTEVFKYGLVPETQLKASHSFQETLA